MCGLHNSEGSAEEHRYVGALAKEKRAFEALINSKEHLVISLPDHPFDLLQAQAAGAAGGGGAADSSYATVT